MYVRVDPYTQLHLCIYITSHLGGQLCQTFLQVCHAAARPGKKIEREKQEEHVHRQLRQRIPRYTHATQANPYTR